jgi:hypothetical protein
MWETWKVKKPRLLILPDDTAPVLKGRCSSCEDVTFSVSRATESSPALIHGMFSEHFRQVHMPEEDAQSASRAAFPGSALTQGCRELNVNRSDAAPRPPGRYQSTVFTRLQVAQHRGELFSQPGYGETRRVNKEPTR